jgi:hypothetical protein
VVLVALISAYRYFCFRFLQGTVAQRLFHWSVVSDDLGPLSRPRSAIRALEGVTVGAAFMTYFGPIPLGLASLWLMIDLTPVLVSRSHQTLLGNLSRTLIVPRPRHWTYERLLSHRRHLEEF